MGGRKSDLCLLEMRLTASIFFRDIRKINFVGDASNQAIVQKTFSAGTTPTNEFCKPRLRLQYRSRNIGYTVHDGISLLSSEQFQVNEMTYPHEVCQH
jgi:hypothetical protein